MLKLAIQGAAGRMGRRLIALAGETDDLRVVAAIDAAASARLGQDAGTLCGIGAMGVPLSAQCGGEFDVMVDFSLPAGAMLAVDACLAAGRPLVSGTTGLNGDQMARLEEAARSIAVLHAPNMSLGVQLMMRAVRELAERLGTEYDIEIVETHHRQKADAPSGTALALLQAVREGREPSGATDPEVIHGRNGLVGARPAGQIGVHAVRMGDVVGRHEVSFGAAGETLTIRHDAHSRDTFARGALHAARWIAGKPAGRYAMGDVLGLR